MFTRSLTAAAITATTLAMASAMYQTWGSVRDRRRFPPPGHMMDVGGRRVHLWIEGEGGPAVVLVPGCGDSSINFATLLPSLARETKTVIFDRAGLGWSDAVWKPMAQLDAADDLRAALHQAGIDPPYVLVGHSMGGYIVRMFAAGYPDEVAGIVLVDSSHPAQHTTLPAYHWRTVKWAVLGRTQWFGIRRLFRDLGISRVDAGRVPSEFARAAVAFDLNDRQRRTAWWEAALRTPIALQVSRRSRSLGAIPLTVLTRAPGNAEASVPFEAWYKLQEDLATLSTNSKHVVAARAGHYIHHDEPELVTEAICDMVRRGRARVSI